MEFLRVCLYARDNIAATDWPFDFRPPVWCDSIEEIKEALQKMCGGWEITETEKETICKNYRIRNGASWGLLQVIYCKIFGEGYLPHKAREIEQIFGPDTKFLIKRYLNTTGELEEQGNTQEVISLLYNLADFNDSEITEPLTYYGNVILPEKIVSQNPYNSKSYSIDIAITDKKIQASLMENKYPLEALVAIKIG